MSLGIFLPRRPHCLEGKRLCLIISAERCAACLGNLHRDRDVDPHVQWCGGGGVIPLPTPIVAASVVLRAGGRQGSSRSQYICIASLRKADNPGAMASMF
jgi:hypothetical protein